jgi:hypothetical protein
MAMGKVLDFINFIDISNTRLRPLSGLQASAAKDANNIVIGMLIASAVYHLKLH